MKHRIIPVLLTDGNTIIKGTAFDNWRTVGSISASANLFASRDVDELILFNVKSRTRKYEIQSSVIEAFTRVLRVPFSFGGGIDNLDDATKILESGAEKVILGTSAFHNPSLINRIASKFGTQAIAVTIDILDEENLYFTVNSGLDIIQESGLSFAKKVTELGAGEIILQSVNRDGSLKGMAVDLIKLFSSSLEVPIVASCGAGGVQDFAEAIKNGASAVAAGAVFQFTEITPNIVREHLKSIGLQVRES
jgi:cyclase